MEQAELNGETPAVEKLEQTLAEMIEEFQRCGEKLAELAQVQSRQIELRQRIAEILGIKREDDKWRAEAGRKGAQVRWQSHRAPVGGFASSKCKSRKHSLCAGYGREAVNGIAGRGPRKVCECSCHA